jgi:hypothetical protein
MAMEREVAFALTWLPKVLLDAGLKVAEQPGWQNRGRGEMEDGQGRDLPSTPQVREMETCQACTP